MSAVIVVQARMGSSRLPGKVLARAGGHVLLALMLDRLAAARLAPVVVATSERGADDAVVAAMAGRPERVVRGSEPDVLDRVLQAAAATHAEHVIRLTADCPLIDPRVIGDVYDAHLAVGADYTSNTLLRTFPDGLDVEVVRRSALAEAAAGATAPVEREHVTPFIVRRPGRYRLAAHVGPLDAEDERWTIDEPADLHWLDELLTRRPELADAGWMEILDVIGRARDPEAGEAVLRVDRTGRGARPADALVLGSAPATRPLQPGHRTWILQVDGRPRGRLIVAVERGIGELGGWIDAEIDPGKALDALDRRLGADLQVVELRCRPAGPLLLHDTLARRGFTFRGGTAVLVRQATDHTIIGAPT